MIQVISVACVTKFAHHFVKFHLVKRVTGIVSGNVGSDIMVLTVRRFVVRIATTRFAPKHLGTVLVVRGVNSMVPNVRARVKTVIAKAVILKPEFVLDRAYQVIMVINAISCVVLVVIVGCVTARLENASDVRLVITALTVRWLAILIVLHDSAAKTQGTVPKIAPLVDGVKHARMNAVQLALKTDAIAAQAIVLLAMTVSTAQSVSSLAVRSALLEHVNAF